MMTIPAVPIGVAVPCLPGVRWDAPDRAARTDLRNALLAEKMIWLEDGAYSADSAVLAATRHGAVPNADLEDGYTRM
jgi:hypothetical protein